MRTPEQIRQHYEIEKELADRLKNASPGERKNLYTSLYNELFKKVPHHPQLLRKKHPELAQITNERNFKLIKRFINNKKDQTFLEVGAGDCSLSAMASPFFKQIYALEVSDEITQDFPSVKNMKLIFSIDGTSIPLSDGSVDIVFSNQLMEHLHPDDAAAQLKNICSVIASDGFYICITPNKFTGPHDISKHFDEVATGFHLKEYTIMELSSMFREAGFSKTIVYAGGKGKYLRIPLFLGIMVENFVSLFSFKVRRKITSLLPIRSILGIFIAAQK